MTVISTDFTSIFQQQAASFTGQVTNSAATGLGAATSALGNISGGNVSGAVGQLTGLGLSAAKGVTSGITDNIKSFAATAFGSVSHAAGAADGSTSSSNDPRVRISPLKPAFYGSGGIMAPLLNTNGVIFPYSPQIQFEQAVNYVEVGMVHTNTDYFSYQRTPSVNINITGKFTCQNQTEGKYALAVIHFFRTASKMYFGEKAGLNAGLPPPILKLNGYGTYMFNELNCILKSHSFSYNEQIDTVQVTTANGYVRLPAMFDISCSLTVQQTPSKMRKEFDLDSFRTGTLMAKGGWI